MSREVFDKLESYRFVLVTGPQRSGTTITAAMIARSHNRLYLPDEVIHQGDVNILKAIVGQGRPFALQCPALFWTVDKLKFERCAVVVMKRDLVDILASIRRIRWDGGQEEIDRYRQRDDFDEVGWATEDATGAITQWKYDFWQQVQKAQMRMDWYELEYDSLRWHPLWIDKQQRKDFEPRQITPEHTNANQDARSWN